MLCPDVVFWSILQRPSFPCWSCYYWAQLRHLNSQLPGLNRGGMRRGSFQEPKLRKYIHGLFTWSHMWWSFTVRYILHVLPICVHVCCVAFGHRTGQVGRRCSKGNLILEEMWPLATMNGGSGMCTCKLPLFLYTFETIVMKTKNLNLYLQVLMCHIWFSFFFSVKVLNFGKILCATCFGFSLNSTFGQEQAERTSKLVSITFFLFFYFIIPFLKNMKVDNSIIDTLDKIHPCYIWQNIYKTLLFHITILFINVQFVL